MGPEEENIRGVLREGGRKGRREGGREGGREGEREREREREGEGEGERERERGRGRGRERVGDSLNFRATNLKTEVGSQIPPFFYKS